MRDTLARIAPDWLRALLGKPRVVSYAGDYPSWEAASRDVPGYGAEIILQRCLAAARAVRAGRAKMERDSVLLAEAEPAWPVLAGLLHAGVANQGRLSVLDFGGALGSTFLLYGPLLRGMDELGWHVVEQPAFVDAGKAEFESGPLAFHEDLESCVAAVSPNVLLLGSVLQYLPDPHGFLSRLAGYGFSHVILDRTPFTTRGRDRIVVQRVREPIYPAAYPCWFFHKPALHAVLERGYDLLGEFPCADRANIPSFFGGSIWVKR